MTNFQPKRGDIVRFIRKCNHKLLGRLGQILWADKNNHGAKVKDNNGEFSIVHGMNSSIKLVYRNTV